MASFRPGAKDKGKKELRPEEAELEEFLFENQIDFVSDQVGGVGWGACMEIEGLGLGGDLVAY